MLGNVFSVLFFLTLAILGLSSAFVFVESMVTLIIDCRMSRGASRPLVCTGVVVVSFLLSLIYCTEFGFYLLAVWTELVTSTTIYQYKDVCDQVGTIGYLVYSLGYILAMVLGMAVGQAVGPEAGAGTGFGIFVLSTVVAIFIFKTPDTGAPGFWGKNTVLVKAWWLAFYSGNQLRRDLNVVIATGKNWSIPAAWPVILRYVSSPILAIVVSFAYPAFKAKSQDPLRIFAFAVAHCVMALIALGFIIPRWFDVFVPAEKLHLSKTFYAPQVTIGPLETYTGGEEAEVRVSEVSHETDEASETRK